MATNRRFTTEQQHEICQAYITGEAPEAICSAWNLGNGTLYRILHKYKIPLRFPNQHRPNGQIIEQHLPGNQILSLPEPADTGKYRYRVGFYVRKTIHADSVESAIRSASGYDGFQELVYLRKEP